MDSRRAQTADHAGGAIPIQLRLGADLETPMKRIRFHFKDGTTADYTLTPAVPTPADAFFFVGPCAGKRAGDVERIEVLS
jgi:hypothetical protein